MIIETETEIHKTNSIGHKYSHKQSIFKHNGSDARYLKYHLKILFKNNRLWQNVKLSVLEFL